MTTQVQQTKMDTKPYATARADKTLTDIREETTAETKTAMNVVHSPPALDPSIYLAMPSVLPSPPMIATVATARFVPPIRFSQQYVSDSQWATMVVALKAYNFLPPPHGMVCPEHHWRDYPQWLQDQITEILMPSRTPINAIAQLPPMVLMASIATQLAPQPSTMQRPPTVPMDVQQGPQPSTSTANLDC
uniref:Uncharacterized protein n=1 Tax=Romanomermis culicivorax TaxID=13658 RepID=A0A915L5B3_ROMCU